jgi:predicted amidohydrolase YtcJ
MHEDQGRRGMSRRDFVKGAATGAALAAGGATLAGKAQAGTTRKATVAAEAKGPDVCDGSRDVALVNGRFLTLDGSDSVVSAVAIRDGRIAETGHAQALGPCSTTINLKGATVIPGLIDSHVHFIRCGLNPGHEVRIIETATSIRELQQMISDRAKSVPAGDFITCIGGWNRNGLAEKRLPTAAELDAAAPSNPVYLSQTGGGAPGGVTNSAGAAFFASKGVAVGANGTIASTGSAQAALVSVQTDDDKRRGTSELMDFSVSLGLTGVHDHGGISGLSPFDYALELWEAGTLKVRIRMFYWSGDDTGIDVAKTRIDNVFNRVGDDRFKPLGIGERINTSTTSPLFVDACRYAAANGWTVTQHSSTIDEIEFHVAAYEAANAENPIADSRWSLCHVNAITPELTQRLIAMGVGVNIQGTRYTSAPSTSAAGPPFRSLLDSGIRAGGGTDATNVAAFNPWLMIYYMTTGKNNAGELLNPGQTITRLEALRLYTLGSASLGFDDDELGTIETGKLADLAVLTDDPLKVSDDKLRKLSSNLTLQAGKVVHASGPFADYA